MIERSLFAQIEQASGLVHALLGIANKEALLSHPVIGQSWEGFVIENLLANRPHGVDGWFYRTSRGAELDLVLSFPGGELWAIEIKRSLTPKLERGFHTCLCRPQSGTKIRRLSRQRNLAHGRGYRSDIARPACRHLAGN